MPFFRVRVRKTTDLFIRVQNNSQAGAEAEAINFETSPTVNILSGSIVSGFPAYTAISTIPLVDVDNSLSKQYARKLAEQAQTSLDAIAFNINSEITSDEFYLLRDNIDLLESTIQIIL